MTMKYDIENFGIMSMVISVISHDPKAQKSNIQQIPESLHSSVIVEHIHSLQKSWNNINQSDNTENPVIMNTEDKCYTLVSIS